MLYNIISYLYEIYKREMKKMEKEVYLYHVVKNIFSIMVQGTISIENFFSVTIIKFNEEILLRYNKWLEYYDRTMKEYDNENESIKDAILLQYIRKCREKNINSTLDFLNNHISKSANIAYDIKEMFSKYEADSKISNPFERIISDLRKLSEEKYNKKEVSSLDIHDVIWYNAEELKILRENKISIENVDGELGGHMMQKSISNDTSYLMSLEEEEKLFQEMVLGVVPVDQ